MPHAPASDALVQAELDELRETQRALVADLLSTQALNESLQEDKVRLSQALGAAEQAASETSQRLDEARGELGKTRGELEALRGERDELAFQVERLSGFMGRKPPLHGQGYEYMTDGDTEDAEGMGETRECDTETATQIESERSAFASSIGKAHSRLRLLAAANEAQALGRAAAEERVAFLQKELEGVEKSSWTTGSTTAEDLFTEVARELARIRETQIELSRTLDAEETIVKRLEATQKTLSDAQTSEKHSIDLALNTIKTAAIEEIKAQKTLYEREKNKNNNNNNDDSDFRNTERIDALLRENAELRECVRTLREDTINTEESNIDRRTENILSSVTELTESIEQLQKYLKRSEQSSLKKEHTADKSEEHRTQNKTTKDPSQSFHVSESAPPFSQIQSSLHVVRQETVATSAALEDLRHNYVMLESFVRENEADSLSALRQVEEEMKELHHNVFDRITSSSEELHREQHSNYDAIVASQHTLSSLRAELKKLRKDARKDRTDSSSVLVRVKGEVSTWKQKLEHRVDSRLSRLAEAVDALKLDTTSSQQYLQTCEEKLSVLSDVMRQYKEQWLEETDDLGTRCTALQRLQSEALDMAALAASRAEDAVARNEEGLLVLDGLKTNVQVAREGAEENNKLMASLSATLDTLEKEMKAVAKKSSRETKEMLSAQKRLFKRCQQLGGMAASTSERAATDMARQVEVLRRKHGEEMAAEQRRSRETLRALEDKYKGELEDRETSSEAKIAELGQRLERAEEWATHLSRALEEKEHELAEARKAASVGALGLDGNVPVSDLQAENDNLSRRCVDLSCENAALMRKVDELQGELDKLSGEHVLSCQSMDTLAANLQQIRDALREQEQQHDRETADLRRSCEGLKAEYERLQRRANSVESDYAAALIEIEGLRRGKGRSK